MSERLNSVDIEDVLSSIRRLVSEDARPGAKSGAAAPSRTAPDPVAEEEVSEPSTPFFATSRSEPEETVAPAPAMPAEPSADKLILTPSLRIVPEAEPDPIPEATVDPAEAAAEDVPEAPMLEDALEEEEPVATPFHSIRIDRGGARLDAVMDQVAQGLDAAEQDWEPVGEAPRAFASDWEDDIAPATTEAATETAEPADPVSASVTEAEDILQGNDVPQADPSSTATGMGWETSGWATPDWQAVEADSSPAEPVVTLQDAVPADVADVSWMAVDAGPVAEEVAAPSVDEDLAAQPADDLADLPDWARMEAEPAVEEAVEFAAAAGMAAAGTSRAKVAEDPKWADAAEAQIRRELEEEVNPSAFVDFDEDDHDERRFDEEMLRDLVRDIIREELQGALGERITRNVRKLVRAEIARAMAVRDFE